MHETLEKYFKGELAPYETEDYFAFGFTAGIHYDFPKNKYVDLSDSYYQKGLEYLNNLDFDFDKYEILGVEKRITFEISGIKMTGFIDLLLKDKETGEIIVVDHKSANLKFKKNGEIYKKDAEHYEQFKRQLYIYSKAVIEEFGKVDYLAWNLFKQEEIHKIPFDEDEYEEALSWAINTINQIRQEILFLPNSSNDFYCREICNYRNNCEYNQRNFKGYDYMEEIEDEVQQLPQT